MRYAVTCGCGHVTELDERQLSAAALPKCSACDRSLTESALATKPLAAPDSATTNSPGTFQQLWQSHVAPPVESVAEQDDAPTAALEPEFNTSLPVPRRSLWDVMKTSAPPSEVSATTTPIDQTPPETLDVVDTTKSKSLWSVMAVGTTDAAPPPPMLREPIPAEISSPSANPVNEREPVHEHETGSTVVQSPAPPATAPARLAGTWPTVRIGSASFFPETEFSEVDAAWSRRAVVSLTAAALSVVSAAWSLQPGWLVRLPSLIAGIAALVLGFMASGEIRRSRGQLKGRLLAISSALLGAMGMFLAPLWFARVGERWRERAAQHEVESRLQHIGQGLDRFHAQQGHYPVASTFQRAASGERQPLHGWMTALLPALGHQAVFQRIDHWQPFDAPANIATMQQIIPEFAVPGRQPQRSPRGFGLTHFAGVGGQAVREPQGLVHFGIFDEAATVRRDQITDGLSQTLIVGEVADAPPPWGQPGNVRFVGDGLNRQFHGFGNPAGTGALFLHADGSVKFYSNKIDRAVLEQLETRDGGEAPNP